MVDIRLHPCTAHSCVTLDFTAARDSECQWHQLGCVQVCTSLQTDNHASTPPLSFLQAGCPSCRSTNSIKALKATSVTYESRTTNSLRDCSALLENMTPFTKPKVHNMSGRKHLIFSSTSTLWVGHTSCHRTTMSKHWRQTIIIITNINYQQQQS